MVDCGKSLTALEIRPTSLLLACSDGTAGLEGLTWSSWGPTFTASGAMGTATGTGVFWQNNCDPDCASGHDQTYPVQVTLSVVASSNAGNFFEQASLVWPASQPPAGTRSTWPLPTPGE